MYVDRLLLLNPIRFLLSTVSTNIKEATRIHELPTIGQNQTDILLQVDTLYILVPTLLFFRFYETPLPFQHLSLFCECLLSMLSLRNNLNYKEIHKQILVLTQYNHNWRFSAFLILLFSFPSYLYC